MQEAFETMREIAESRQNKATTDDIKALIVESIGYYNNMLKTDDIKLNRYAKQMIRFNMEQLKFFSQFKIKKYEGSRNKNQVKRPAVQNRFEPSDLFA